MKGKPNNNRKEVDDGSTVVGITLYPEDQDCIDKIKRAHGLLRDTDCVRFALRQAVRSLNAEEQAA